MIDSFQELKFLGFLYNYGIFNWGCEWGQPTSDKKYFLTTDKMSKKLPTTDRKNINRPPTWADIINICFQKKEHFVFNLTVSSRK